MSLSGRADRLDAILTPPFVIPARRRIVHTAALVLAHTGDAAVWAVLLAIGWLLGDVAWKGRALVTAAGLIVTELVVVSIKFLIRRPRPEGRSGLIYRKMDPYSFPSGHAARAAMLIVLFAVSYPPWSIVAVSIWGPAMVLARVAIGIHYVLDVVAGAVLGAGLAWGVLALVPVVAALV
jgi:membrane-associated phospholipid phosphatase